MTLLGSLLNIPVFWLVGTLIYPSIVWVLAFPSTKYLPMHTQRGIFSNRWSPTALCRFLVFFLCLQGILFQCYLPSQHFKSFNHSEFNFCLHCFWGTLIHLFHSSSLHWISENNSGQKARAIATLISLVSFHSGIRTLSWLLSHVWKVLFHVFYTAFLKKLFYFLSFG